MTITATRRALWPEFQWLWARLVEESASEGTWIVVEGERDRHSLRRLGVAGPVVLLHRGRPLSGIAHEVTEGARRVVVLTDWDAEGGHLARRLAGFWEGTGLVVDLDSRRRLARLLRGELTHVEALYGWARRTALATGEPIEHWLATLDGVGPIRE